MHPDQAQNTLSGIQGRKRRPWGKNCPKLLDWKSRKSASWKDRKSALNDYTEMQHGSCIQYKQYWKN